MNVIMAPVSITLSDTKMDLVVVFFVICAIALATQGLGVSIAR